MAKITQRDTRGVERLDFTATEESARRMSDQELHYALVDIQKTLPHADAMDRESGGERGGLYRDEASVYHQERARRQKDDEYRTARNAENARGQIDHEVAADYHIQKAAQLRDAGKTDAASWHSTAAWAHRDASEAALSNKPGDVKALASRNAQDASANAHGAERRSPAAPTQRVLPGTGPVYNKARPEDVSKLAREPKPSDTERRSLTADIARANQNLEHVRKKRLPPDEHMAESAKWLRLKNESEQKLAKMSASERSGVQEGARGGRFYIAATGAKVYVKNNPGAETVGHMSNQRFHQGLPMSVHLAEPKKSR